MSSDCKSIRIGCSIIPLCIKICKITSSIKMPVIGPRVATVVLEDCILSSYNPIRCSRGSARPILDKDQFRRATETVTYSIVGAIRDLCQTNNLFLALVLGLFSVAFPVFKLCLYWLATVYQDKPHSMSSLVKWTARHSKFSMVEVLFLALLILTVKTLPGGSEATIEWGAYLFVASALGSMLIPLLIEKTNASGAD